MDWLTVVSGDALCATRGAAGESWRKVVLRPLRGTRLLVSYLETELPVELEFVV